MPPVWYNGSVITTGSDADSAPTPFKGGHAMIKVQENNNEVECKIEGSAIDVCSEIGVVINKAYRIMCDDNPIIGAVFRAVITNLVNDDDAPTWKLD